MPIAILSWLPAAAARLWWHWRARRLRKAGLLCFERGELDKAEEHFSRELALNEKVGDKTGQMGALSNLFMLHRRRGETRRQQECLRKSATIHQEILQEDHDRAHERYDKALVVAEETNDALAHAQALSSLGIAHRRKDELSEAANYHERALTIYRENGDCAGQAAQLYFLALLMEQRGELDRARDLLNEAKTLYETIASGDQGPMWVRVALERLAATTPAQPKRKLGRKRAPRKRP